jgi:hypothetical protein
MLLRFNATQHSVKLLRVNGVHWAADTIGRADCDRAVELNHEREADEISSAAPRLPAFFANEYMLFLLRNDAPVPSLAYDECHHHW